MFNFTGNVDITTRHFMQEAEHWLWERYGQHSSPWTQWVIVLEMQYFGASEAHLLEYVNIASH